MKTIFAITLPTRPSSLLPMYAAEAGIEHALPVGQLASEGSHANTSSSGLSIHLT